MDKSRKQKKIVRIGVLFDTNDYKYLFGKHKALFKLDYLFSYTSGKEKLSSIETLVGYKNFCQFVQKNRDEFKFEIILIDVAPLWIELIRSYLSKNKINHSYVYYQHGFSSDNKINHYLNWNWWVRNLQISINYFLLERSFSSLKLITIYFMKGSYAGLRENKNILTLKKAYLMNDSQINFFSKINSLDLKSIEKINFDKDRIAYAKNNKVIFVGQNLVQCELISQKEYEFFIQQVANYFYKKSYQFLYLPHPKEEKNLLPKDVELIDGSQFHECQLIAGFYSSMLSNQDDRIPIALFYDENLKFNHLINSFEKELLKLKTKRINKLKL